MTNQPRNLVGSQVRRIRCNAGLSQPAMAEKCQRLGWDVGRDAIAKIEGLSRCVSDSELVFLARVLNCALLDLYPENVKASLRRKS